MLQLLSARLRRPLSLREVVFFPIPRNRRRYVRSRSVRSYELRDIFFIARRRFPRSYRREEIEAKKFAQSSAYLR